NAAAGSAVSGQYSNLGTADGAGNVSNTAVTHSKPDFYFGLNPAINIVKLTNNTNNDSAPGLHVLAGSAVTWTYVVTNPGNEPLKSVSVVDDRIGTLSAPAGDANSNGLLDVGETWTYTATGTAVSGQYSNLGTAAGTGNVSNTAVTHSNPDFYFGLNPAINIVKLTNNTNNDVAPGIQLVAGATVTWTYVVTNPGNEPLKSVSVVDDHIGTLSAHTGDANSNGLLDVGETWTYTANGTAVSGQYSNLGTAAGTGNVSNRPVTHSNPDFYFGQINGAINIVVLTNGTNNDAPTGPHLEVLDNVNWTYIVTNPGNEPLTGVTVPDNVVGPITNFAGGDTNSNGRPG